MGSYQTQNDLADLPEPRFVCAAPIWLRNFGTVMIFVCFFFSTGALAHGTLGPGKILTAVAGAVGTGVCGWVLVALRPHDWRSWISLAAAPEGLYLVASPRRVVFVPWQDVKAIDVTKIFTANGARDFGRLTLTMSEEAWSTLGTTSNVKGRGPTRDFLMSALTMPGKQLAAELQAFRESFAR